VRRRNGTPWQIGARTQLQHHAGKVDEGVRNSLCVLCNAIGLALIAARSTGLCRGGNRLAEAHQRFNPVAGVR
jgi:hypothetical protein